MRIFVSYTLRDSCLSLQRLKDICVVASRFGTPFIDALHNDSECRQIRVEDELRLAHAVLFLKSPQFSASPWAEKEARLTLSLKKMHIDVCLSPTTAWSGVLADVAAKLSETANNALLFTPRKPHQN